MIHDFFDSFDIEEIKLALGCAVIFFVLIIIFNVSRNSLIKNKKLHGTARWADKKDISQMGLLNGAGVYVGGWKDKSGTLHYLRHNGFEHTLTFSPTGSGKDICLGIPTCLSWPHSIVINDPKSELYALSAGWRKKYANNKIIKFEPASRDSAKWNPLNEIRLEGHEVGDAQNIVSMIVDPYGKGELDHWEETSQPLLVGVILHMIFKAKREGTPMTLPYVDQLLSPIDTSVNSLWLEMLHYPHVNGETHRAVAASARDMLDRPEEEAGSILSTAKRFLSLYRDPIVAKNVSSSDFYIKDLMNHETPVSLYLMTSSSDRARLKPIIRLMVASIFRVLCSKIEYHNIPDKRDFFDWLFKSPARTSPKQKITYKHRLLCYLGELPTLGKIADLEDTLAISRAHGISFYLSCQDIRQLRKKKFGYSEDETITSNCHIQNAFSPNNMETAEHLSKLTGETTVVVEKITTSGKRAGLFHSNVSRHFDSVKRNLLTADECMRLPGAKKNKDGLIVSAGDMLISVAGFPVIYGHQTLYFQDPIFLARASIPAPEYSDKIRHEKIIKEDEQVEI